MRNIFHLFILLFSFVSLDAQIVHIPDANFKAKLLSANASNGIAMDADGNNITIDVNGDGEIQISEALSVYRLYVAGLADFPQLHISDLTGVEEFLNLRVLHCGLNNISNLNISELVNVEYLICVQNELTELNVSSLVNLQYLLCEDNNLNDLDVSNLENLIYLAVGYNSLTSLDLSNNQNLEFLDFRMNQITYLNLKNGSGLDEEPYSMAENADAFGGFSNFANICVDEQERDFIEFFMSDMFEWDINTYCNYFPIEDHNIITGNITFDSENNDCDENDEPQQFIKINVNDGGNQHSSFTDISGNYIFYTQDGTYTLTPQTENPEFFNINPANATVNFLILNGSTQTQNFCITPNGIHPDVEIIISPLEPARPGFEATYKIFYRNKGNQTVSGNIDFEFNDELLDFNSSNPVPNNQSEGLLIYNFTELHPFESREITLSFQVNTPTETPPVNIDDVLTFKAEIQINPTDENPSDNIFELNQIVVGAYDPNDITCLQGESVSPEMIGEKFHYRIRFENTGNYPAERVVVAMPINPEQYDVSSFQLLNISHQVQARVVNNTAEFFFEQIRLQPEGQGDILFSIKSLDTLNIGDSVMSYADIYFDYNYPITTNEAETTFEILGLNEINPNVQVSVYPNPAKDFIQIKSDSKINKIELYDASARLLKVIFTDKFESNQNLSTFPNGIYFVKIYTDNGTTTNKIIKE